MALNLGQVTFGLYADTSQLKESIQQLRAFAEQTQSAVTMTDKLKDAQVAAATRQESAIRKAADQGAAFFATVQRLGAPIALTNELSDAMGRLRTTMQSGQLNTLQMARATDQYRAALVDANIALKNWQAEQKKVSSGDGPRGINSIADAFRLLSEATVIAAGPLSGIGSRIAAIAGIAAVFGTQAAIMATAVAGATAGLYEFAKAAITVATTTEQIQAKFIQATGSLAGARLEMNFAAELARKYGIDLKTLSNEYASFSAAASEAGYTQEQVRKIFLGTATAAAAMRLNSEQLQGVLLALTQIAGKGVLSMEELRRQLGNQLPGALGIAAKSMGITTSELYRLVTAGQISGKTFLEAFGALTAQHFAEGAAEGAKTLTAALANVGSAFFQMMQAMDNATGVSVAFKEALNVTAAAMDAIRNNSTKVVDIFGAFAGAIIGIAAPTIWGGIVALSSAIFKVATAVRELGVAAAFLRTFTLDVSTLARLGLAIAGAVAGYAAMAYATRNVSQEHDVLMDRLDATITGIEKMKATSESSVATLIHDTEARIAALKDEQAQMQANLDLTIKQQQAQQRIIPEGGEIGLGLKTKELQDQKDSLDAITKSIIQYTDKLNQLKSLKPEEPVDDLTKSGQKAWQQIEKLVDQANIWQDALLRMADGNEEGAKTMNDFVAAAKILDPIMKGSPADVQKLTDKLHDLGYQGTLTTMVMSLLGKEFEKQAKARQTNILDPKAVEQATEAVAKLRDQITQTINPGVTSSYKGYEEEIRRIGTAIEKTVNPATRDKLVDLANEFTQAFQTLQALQFAAALSQVGDKMVAVSHQIDVLQTGPSWGYDMSQDVYAANEAIIAFQKELAKITTPENASQMQAIEDAFTGMAQQIPILKKNFEAMQADMQLWKGFATSSFQEIGSQLADAVVEGKALNQVFADTAKAIAKMAIQMAIFNALQKATGLIPTFTPVPGASGAGNTGTSPTPGNSIDYSGGGSTVASVTPHPVTVNYNIDARGATPGTAAQIKSILQQQSAQTTANTVRVIADRRKRGF